MFSEFFHYERSVAGHNWAKTCVTEIKFYEITLKQDIGIFNKGCAFDSVSYQLGSGLLIFENETITLIAEIKMELVSRT